MFTVHNCMLKAQKNRFACETLTQNISQSAKPDIVPPCPTPGRQLHVRCLFRVKRAHVPWL